MARQVGTTSKPYAESHEVWLSTLFSLPNGVPHADTHRRLFERMAPDALERCFLGWVKQIVEGSGAQVIPIDGKTIKGSYDRNTKQSALHVVSAWASEHRQVWAVPVAMMGNLHQIEQWAGLRTLVMVKRVRHLWNKITQETMVYLTSLPCDAAVIHWSGDSHPLGN